MIIDIGTGVDESVVKWKYNDKDKWRDADIDELIHLYESIVHCKDCRYYEQDVWREVDGVPIIVAHHICEFWNGACHVKPDGYCSFGERAEQTDYKMPGYDDIMEKLDELTLKGGDHE